MRCFIVSAVGKCYWRRGRLSRFLQPSSCSWEIPGFPIIEFPSARPPPNGAGFCSNPPRLIVFHDGIATMTDPSGGDLTLSFCELISRSRNKLSHCAAMMSKIIDGEVSARDCWMTVQRIIMWKKPAWVKLCKQVGEGADMRTYRHLNDPVSLNWSSTTFPLISKSSQTRSPLLKHLPSFVWAGSLKRERAMDEDTLHALTKASRIGPIQALSDYSSDGTSPCLLLIAFWLVIALPIFWQAIVAQISCSLANETQNTNRTNGLKTIKNQNNIEVLQIIRPKCPGRPIGAKQEWSVTRSVKVILTHW
jgi:hypothetical protein